MLHLLNKLTALGSSRRQTPRIAVFALVIALVSASMSFPAKSAIAESSKTTTRTFTIYFGSNSSALTSAAKTALRKVFETSKSTQGLTITGYAPKKVPVSQQNRLALARANAAKSFLKRLGSKPTATIKTSLLKSSSSQKIANKATIQVSMNKIVPTTTPSPSVSPTLTPTASPTSSPMLDVSGRLTLNFVDCNSDHQQVLGKELKFTPVSVGAEPIIFELPSSSTQAKQNNLMNCTISWNSIPLPIGSYNLSLLAQCFEILDSETSANAACTPNRYGYFDLGAGQPRTLSGLGPVSSDGTVNMELEMPNVISISGETDLEVNLD